jgi:L-lactate dehydrogenase complex protein LldG
MDSSQASLTTAELRAVFKENAAAVAAAVQSVPDLPGLCEAVLRIAGESSNIVLGPDEFLPSGTMDALRELPGVLKTPTDQQLSLAHVGITAAFSGVASSGSVCILMGQPLAAAASLLVPVHIVLLDASRIIARPSDIFRADCFAGEGLRRDIVFVCGPSATADMGPLVRGVHGPHRLHILLIG